MRPLHVPNPSSQWFLTPLSSPRTGIEATSLCGPRICSRSFRDVQYNPTLPVASSSWLQAIQSMKMFSDPYFLSFVIEC